MKLYQTIVIYDVVVAAANEADANETALKWVRGGYEGEAPLAISEGTSREIREERNIRTVMRDVKPIIGEAISDDDFEICRGKTNLEVFRKIYTKEK